MDEAKANRPDGSSIKPVSSLLARFENLNKLPPPSQPSSRPRSPAPKPERLRNFKPSIDISASNPSTPSAPSTPTKPFLVKDKPLVKPKPSVSDDKPPPIPDPSTRPALDAPQATSAPSVTVQPPLSPPKEPVPRFVQGDESPFLDPTTPAAFTPGGSSKPSSVPSRPLSPANALPAPKSPKFGSSKPPSPPPPRRSSELRRDRETRALTPVRAQRDHDASPNLQASQFPERHESLVKQSSGKETSPFTSPPNSSESEEEAPPRLPVRPGPSFSDAAVRYMPEAGGFEPPPVHHAVARRRDKDHAPGAQMKNGPAAAHDEERPPLPLRRQTHDQVSKSKTSHAQELPPSRPPRPFPRQSRDRKAEPAHSLPPTLSSSPQTAPQFLPPPTRHARSATIDRAMERGDSQLSTSPENKTPVESSSTLPDISEVNRKPPFVKKTSYEIQTRYDPKRFDVCGDVVCTTGHLTRAWNLVDGEQLMSLSHTEGIKATAVSFKPAATPDKEGTRLWVATNTGDVMEVEVATNRISYVRPNVHGKQDVIKIYRSYNELWSLDESGNLLVWGPDTDGMPNLDLNPSQAYKVPKGHTFSMAVGSELWYAAGKVLRVFAPSPDGSTTFQVLLKPLVAEGTADITSGAVLDGYTDKAFFGHVDGKVSVYSTKEYVCQKVVNVSGWKINALTGVGSHLWVGYSNGRICVYDTAKTPWALKKEWQAHDGGIYQLKLDTAAPYKLSRSQVISLGPDGKAKIWDGLLQDDWIENDFKSKADRYCDFDHIKLMVMTWNAGASTPYSLRYSDGDATFIQELLQSSGSPDILVFGFQELVDLEDKTATAKRFLKSKKREGSDNESMSHRYRDWRDFLLKSLDDYMPADDLYHLLFNAPLVGLFSCVFVKSTLQPRISNLQGAEVKRGMGGLHGNKGAVAVRFHIDDTSLCLVNCHLAAGQSQTSSRHNDVAGIMEANLFQTGRDTSSRLNCYNGGGDGSMIIDHELCILNGDLNYRIDTMSRDTVAKAVQQGNLTKLLERDQLLVSRRRNPIFRLRAFDELPLTFAPTYKYDVGTDRYDTSEKRRSPAWCDRVLYRGKSSVEQLDYKRHEVRVSDHRPVTARFRLRVKKIDDRERAAVWMESTQGFEDVREKRIQESRINYLLHTCGFDEATSKRFIKDKLAKQNGKGRSPSRAGRPD